MLKIINNTGIIYDYSNLISKRTGYDESLVMDIDYAPYEAIYREMGIENDVILTFYRRLEIKEQWGECCPVPFDFYKKNIPVQYYEVNIDATYENPVGTFIHELGHILYTDFDKQAEIKKNLIERKLPSFSDEFTLDLKDINKKLKYRAMGIAGYWCDEIMMEKELVANHRDVCDKYGFKLIQYGKEDIKEQLSEDGVDYLCEDAIVSLFETALGIEDFDKRHLVLEEICMLMWHAAIHAGDLVTVPEETEEKDEKKANAA